MAHVSISKAFLVVAAAVMLLSACDVSAQDSTMAPSPSPSMDTGAGFSLPVSIVVFVSSFVFSLVALS
ncbi:hypothetical protein L484_015979 [Morus notabilis]|uniref:Uncharacterized protein n=1 Tax=Morus notabilis TaxID=981085 RepID=W9RZ54_9ROSA|nr:hypothetical protein L484_015979 [Morus notabilis]